MCQYMLTLMVRFEQEYAIQDLFGRRGWKYTKITDEIPSFSSFNLPKSKPSETCEPGTRDKVNRQVVGYESYKRNAHTVPQNIDCNIDCDRNNEHSVVSAAKNDDVNDLKDNIKLEENSHAFGEDNFGNNHDEKQTLNRLDIVVKVEVESENDDVSDSDSDKSSNTENSRFLKRGATTQTNKVRWKKRKEGASAIRNENSKQSDANVKMETLPTEDLEKVDPLAILETLSGVEHVSEMKSDGKHDLETFLNGTADSGFSAILGAYYCKDCSYTFPEESYYTMHKRDGKCVFSCQFCSEKYTFRNFSKYQEHVKQHRLDGFICKECGKHLKTRGGLSSHERLHAGKAPYRCCGKPFFSLTNLERHRCTKHNAPKRLKCDQCKYACGIKSDLTTHWNRVHKEPDFRCEICGRRFMSAGMLKDHESSHSGEKHHFCTCGKAYHYSSGLSKHRKKCKK